VFVELRHDGRVTFYEGYISQAEGRRNDKEKRGSDDPSSAPVKPEMSGPLAEYILLHRHGAAQASLAAQPAIALRLMVAHAMTGSALWTIRPHECSSRKDATRASLEASTAAAEMAAKRERVTSLFAAMNVSGETRRNGDAYRLCEIFAALLAMSDAEVGELLAFAMAETLEAGGAVVEAVLHVCETDLSACWKPEPAFFALCRDKRAINAMVADIGSESLAATCVTDTARCRQPASWTERGLRLLMPGHGLRVCLRMAGTMRSQMQGPSQSQTPPEDSVSCFRRIRSRPVPGIGRLFRISLSC